MAGTFYFLERAWGPTPTGCRSGVRRRSILAAAAGAYGALGILLVCSVAACGRAPEEKKAPSKHTPRPLTNVVFDRTPARVQRGGYLTESLLQCFVCHSERDWDAPGAPPIAITRAAGAVWWDKPWLVAPNLTPDADTGIGRWTDDMLVRAIRDGVGHDGRVLDGQMWSYSFHRLTDEDVASVVVYLRSLKPIRHALPATAMPPDIAAQADPLEPVREGLPAPDSSDAVQRGGYLAYLANCEACHTSWHTPKNPGLYGGGNLIERSGRHAFSANLTTDPSGIPHYDAAMFRDVIRSGKLKGRMLSPVMPWVVFKNLNDADLNDLFAFLRAVRPVSHTLDNINPSTACAACGGSHPLGEFNKPHELHLVSYALDDVRDFVGAYRFESGFRLTFAIEGGKFVIYEQDERKGCVALTEDRIDFFCGDCVDRARFARGADGRVTHVLGNGTNIGVRVK